MGRITNQERFNILRGYYQNNMFHPMGGKGITEKELVNQIGFDKHKDFLLWYNSLSQKDIEAGKKDWCSGRYSGNCCQSNLIRLLKNQKIQLNKLVS